MILILKTKYNNKIINNNCNNKNKIIIIIIKLKL